MENRSGIFRWLIAASLSISLHAFIMSADYSTADKHRAADTLRLRLFTSSAGRGTDHVPGSPSVRPGEPQNEAAKKAAEPAAAAQRTQKEQPAKKSPSTEKKKRAKQTPKQKKEKRAEKATEKTAAPEKKADIKPDARTDIARGKAADKSGASADAPSGGNTGSSYQQRGGVSVPDGRSAVVSISELSVRRRVKPAYPMASRKRGESGTAVLIISIDGGRVTSVSIERSSGHKALDEAAVTAVRKWEFASAGLIKARVPVTFSLKGN